MEKEIRQSEVEIGIASNLMEVLSAWRLVYECYLQSGFISKNPDEIFTFPEAIHPLSAVVCGYKQNQIIHTLTAISGRESNLPLETAYPRELARLRAAQRTLLEVGLHAHKPGESSRSLKEILSILSYVYFYGVYSGHSDLLCGVPPSDAPFYKKLFGFEQIGELKAYEKVNSCPVIPMKIDLSIPLQELAENFKGFDYIHKHIIPEYLFEKRFTFDQETIRQCVLENFRKPDQPLRIAA